MCLIFFALDQHPDYKLVVAGNRDEFYKRKTAVANFWDDHPEILAGRDLEAMGTWLGIARTGRISMLTNYRDLRTLKKDAPSRGHLVSDFLWKNMPPDQYLQQVAEEGHRFNGFNLLVGTADEFWYYSSYGNGIVKLDRGIFGLSNHLLDTPWPKVARGKVGFKSILDTGIVDTEALFKLLYDEDIAEDNFLPDTGLPLERERALSSMFIKTPDYGSRCSTVTLVDPKHQVTFKERVFDVTTFSFQEQSFEFVIGT